MFSYFSITAAEWNKLDKCIRNSEGFSIFSRRVFWNSCGHLQTHNPNGIKLLTSVRLGLVDLREHTIKSSFQDLLNPICNYEADIDTTPHSLPHFSLFSDERLIFINNIWNIDNNILNLNDSRFSEVLLFGNWCFNIQKVHLF